MIRINLLPFRAARKKENIRQQVSIYLLSLIFIGIAVIYYNSVLNNKITDLTKDIKDTKVKVAKYNKINAEIATIKKNLSILTKKTNVIKSLETNRRAQVKLLDSMTRLIIPRRMWFTSFQVKNNGMKVAGIALDDKTVADFMTNLTESKLYTGVKLAGTQPQKISGQNLILKRFNISFKKPSLDKPGKDKKKKKRKKS